MPEQSAKKEKKSPGHIADSNTIKGVTVFAQPLLVQLKVMWQEKWQRSRW